MGNVSGRFSFLRAELCAGSPRLIVVLTLAALVFGRDNCPADEPVKLAMATHATTSSTNAAKVTPKTTTAETNSFSASFRQPPATASLPVTASGPATTDNNYSAVVVIALVKKRPAPTGLFAGQPGNGNFGFANIEAGYGQAYDCDSVVLRGNNGTATEETRYIFFKKVVKF